MNHEKVVVELELDDILPNRFQPRFKFHEQAITELSESIKEHGVIQPILVRRLGDKYEIIAGERRYKASLLAGKHTIPAIIAELNDKDSAEVALIENVQRQDLTPIEEAVSYRKILDMGYLTQEQLAEKLGKTQSTISNKLRLLNLDDDVQEALLDEKISERHARSLLKIDSKQKQKEILQRIINERLTVKKTDDLINQILSGNEVNELNNIAIPNIFMNNSVQVDEPAIQSSSAIEFINPLENNIVNSFNSNQNETKDSDILDFLNSNSNEQQVENNIPIEEIEENDINNTNNKINDISLQSSENENNFSKFEIPTSPIIEEIEDVPVQPSLVGNNEKELDEINKMINSINPGFVDVDKIEKDAKDIYVEKPLADIDNLMMSSNNNIPVETHENEMDSNNDIQVEPSLQQNKFFTMFSPIDEPEINETQDDEEKEEKFNFTPIIENEQSVNQFLEPEKNEEANNNVTEKNDTPFSFNNYDSNVNTFSYNQSYEQNQDNDTSLSEMQNNQESNLNISDFYDNQDNLEEINDEPKVINYPNDNILAESVRKEDVVKEDIVDNNIYAAADLKTVINTIRNCADTIEKYGFALECEEYDFEDMYQVIFKIQKKDKY